MSNEISRVYQFLSNQDDWAVKADKNGDGVILKSEFRSFLEENLEWNGEASAQNDLINEFWAKIDTNSTRTKISGTNITNQNALDANELASLDNRIEMYETLNEYTSNISCPNIISDSAKAWKEDVTFELQALLETYIQEGGTNENLPAYLEENAPTVENKVTAEYCAAEYLDEVMPELNKEYGYAFGDDKDLNDLIKNYAQNLPEGATPEEMKETLTNIIDAYLATAGLGEANGVDLAQYGYNTENEAPLNDLQESIAKTTLTKNLEAIKNDEYYEQFAATIDSAIAAFVEDTVSNATAADFKTILSYGVEQFKQSEGYQEIQMTLDVKQVMIYSDNTSALYQAIEQELGSTIAEILTEGVYFDAYEEIINQAIEKANDGAFDVNGEFNSQALIDWAVGEIEENLTTILNQSGSAEDLTSAELYELYTKSAEAADSMKTTDSDKALAMHKEAAIAYCDGIAAKGENHKALLEEVFGSSNYTSAINSCKKPSDIQEYIESINAQAGNIKEETKVSDKSQQVLNALANDTSIPERETLTFVVEADGTIRFVNYQENQGPWDDPENTTLDKAFNTTIKNQIETTYSEELENLGLTDLEKKNLFNIALFTTLSDTSVMKSMYDEVALEPIIDKFVENYTEMLAKVAGDENARNYIKNVSNKSLLNGHGSLACNHDEWGFQNLAQYYTDSSTTGSDNWVAIYTRQETTFSYADTSGNIILVASSDAGDNGAINSAMKSILTDYINSYKDVLEPNKIIELFKKAQETAFMKLDAMKNAGSADGTSVYGYGEASSGSAAYDTFNGGGFSVQTVLINIMYEMERLISKEVMGM